MMHSMFYGQAPSYISEIVTPVQSHIYQSVPTYVRRKTETTTFHGAIISVPVLFSFRKRTLESGGHTLKIYKPVETTGAFGC